MKVTKAHNSFIVSQNIKGGKEPVVVLSLKHWEYLQDRLEDLEMSASSLLRKKITTARNEKKNYTPREVRRALGL